MRYIQWPTCSRKRKKEKLDFYNKIKWDTFNGQRAFYNEKLAFYSKIKKWRNMQYPADNSQWITTRKRENV